MRKSYKLRKEQNLKKKEKAIKILKMCNIIIFKSTRNKLTASGNIILAILNHKFMDCWAIYGYLKNKRLPKKAKINEAECRSP